LNRVLDSNDKAKVNDRHTSLGYFCSSWDEVKNCFPISLGAFPNPTGKGLPHHLLVALHGYLSCATVCFGVLSESREDNRLHFIAPIIIIVCAYFNGNIEILAKEDVIGNRVHAHSHFEFVLKRGNKRICIVEAKKDDILQGKTQSLVACEALCDVEDLSVAYGISTNFVEWCFLKNEAHKITEELLTLSFVNSHPTKESLRIIANKIIAILE
jgi:hypothetical protein